MGEIQFLQILKLCESFIFVKQRESRERGIQIGLAFEPKTTNLLRKDTYDIFVHCGDHLSNSLASEIYLWGKIVMAAEFCLLMKNGILFDG